MSVFDDHNKARRADQEMARYMQEIDVIRAERRYWEAQIKTLRDGVPDTDDYRAAAHIMGTRADHISYAKGVNSFANRVIAMLNDALQLIDSALDDPDPDWPLIERVIKEIKEKTERWSATPPPSSNLIFTPGIFGRC